MQKLWIFLTIHFYQLMLLQGEGKPRNALFVLDSKKTLVIYILWPDLANYCERHWEEEDKIQRPVIQYLA